MRKKFTILCLLALCGSMMSVKAATGEADEPNDDAQRRKVSFIAIDPMGPDEPSLILIGTDENHRMRHEYMRVFRETMQPGFQESKPPRFVITGKDSRFLFGIGGFVNFRTAYDFDGMVDNTDFVTYDIPIPGTPATRGKINMDASTTRLFFKIIGRTKKLGDIETYIETDFRGDGHNLRLRKAYVSFLGFLFGQNTTTFCDLTAAPTTIDFEGPNGYSYDRNLQIRYSHAFNKHWSVALAVEYPMLSATYAPTLNSELPQRVPDIPGYVQFTWGKYSSHLRASGIFRGLNYYNDVKAKSEYAYGWGAMLSGNIKIGRYVSTFFQALYGQGITQYIQDLQGSGLDLVENPHNAGSMQTLPMYGLVGGAQFNITKNLFVSGAYSMVRVYNERDYFVGDMYRRGQYIVANAFYNIIPSCQVGVEYLYGTRKNMNMQHNKANRVQAMIQYNF